MCNVAFDPHPEAPRERHILRPARPGAPEVSGAGCVCDAQRQLTREGPMKGLLALALLSPAIAIGKSPFDGTWKTRLDSLQFSGKPDVYELNNGMYDCKSCAPPYKIKADGSEQPVPEHDYL